jgi:hypothetical protein
MYTWNAFRARPAVPTRPTCHGNVLCGVVIIKRVTYFLIHVYVCVLKFVWIFLER